MAETATAIQREGGVVIKFRKDKVGRNAYKVTKKWRLGPHIFVCGEDLIFRICYLRNKNGTHYIDFSLKIKEHGDCGCAIERRWSK